MTALAVGQQSALQKAGPDTCAAGFKGRLIGKQDLREQVRKEDPLRNLARAASPGCGAGCPGARTASEKMRVAPALMGAAACG